MYVCSAILQDVQIDKQIDRQTDSCNWDFTVLEVKLWINIIEWNCVTIFSSISYFVVKVHNKDTIIVAIMLHNRIEHISFS